MAEYSLPEFDDSLRGLAQAVDDTLADMRDFRAALESSGTTGNDNR